MMMMMIMIMIMIMIITRGSFQLGTLQGAGVYTWPDGRRKTARGGLHHINSLFQTPSCFYMCKHILLTCLTHCWNFAEGWGG